MKQKTVEDLSVELCGQLEFDLRKDIEESRAVVRAIKSAYAAGHRAGVTLHAPKYPRVTAIRNASNVYEDCMEMIGA